MVREQEIAMKGPPELKNPDSYPKKLQKTKAKHDKAGNSLREQWGVVKSYLWLSFGSGLQGSVDQHPHKSLWEDFLHSLEVLLGTTHREGQQEIELNYY